jgi:head-tail adaptor
MRRMLDEITIQTRTTSKSTTGGITETWADECTWPATFHPTGGREVRQMSRSYPTADGFFELLRSPDAPLTTAKRIYCNSKYFDIEYIDDVGDRGRRDRLMVVVKYNAN